MTVCRTATDPVCFEDSRGTREDQLLSLGPSVGSESDFIPGFTSRSAKLFWCMEEISQPHDGGMYDKRRFSS